MKFTNALVVKLVDTKALKSLPFWECQFESGRGHQKKDDSRYNYNFTNKPEISLKGYGICEKLKWDLP